MTTREASEPMLRESVGKSEKKATSPVLGRGTNNGAGAILRLFIRSSG